MLIISNRPCALHSSNFEITHAIFDQVIFKLNQLGKECWSAVIIIVLVPLLFFCPYKCFTCAQGLPYFALLPHILSPEGNNNNYWY